MTESSIALFHKVPGNDAWVAEPRDTTYQFGVEKVTWTNLEIQCGGDETTTFFKCPKNKEHWLCSILGCVKQTVTSGNTYYFQLLRCKGCNEGENICFRIIETRTDHVVGSNSTINNSLQNNSSNNFNNTVTISVKGSCTDYIVSTTKVTAPSISPPQNPRNGTKN
jgi:hypothetical protein